MTAEKHPGEKSKLQNPNFRKKPRNGRAAVRPDETKIQKSKSKLQKTNPQDVAATMVMKLEVLKFEDFLDFEVWILKFSFPKGLS
jgi:hypothetical protein